MAEQNLGPRDFFAKEDAIADLGLIACPGAEELCKLVDSHLVRWAREVGNTDVDTFIIRPTARVSSPATQRVSSRRPPAATTCISSSIRATTALPISCSGMRTISPRTTTSRT